MPRYQVTGPDGRKYEVTAPDGATQQQILEYVQSQAASQQPQQSAADIGRSLVDVGKAVAQQPSFLKRLGFGAADMLVGVGQLGANLVPQFVSDQLGVNVGEEANRETREREAAYQASRGPDAGFDGGRLTGNILTALPAALIPGGQSVIGSTAIGAGIGAAQPVTGEDYWSEKGKQTAVGGITAGVTTGALNTLGRAFKQPALSPEELYLQSKGVQMRPDQYFPGLVNDTAEKLQSAPIVGDAIKASQRRTIESFNRAAYNEVLKPIGQTLDDNITAGRTAVAAVQRKASEAFDDALSRMQFVPDEQFAAELANLKSLTREMPDDLRKTFDLLMNRKLETFIKGNGSMDGKTIQIAERGLRALSDKFSKAQDPTAQELLGPAFKEAHRIFGDALERMNPQAAPMYRAAKQTWAMLQPLRKAALTSQKSGGLFTPAQLAQKAVMTDQTVGKSASIMGRDGLLKLAETAQARIGNTIPNSGTTDRLLSNLALGGAGYYFSPTALAGTLAGAAAYTRPGQALLNGMIAGQRPAAIQGIGSGLQRLAAPAGLLGAAIANQ